MTKVAAVIGGGLQGICSALMLTRKGFQVKLFERTGSLMGRASLNNEGKIHLGFVYARDKTLRTAHHMIEAALYFAPTIENLIGRKLEWLTNTSTPFVYGIHKDSSLDVDELAAYYAQLESAFHEKMNSLGTAFHYLGEQPGHIWEHGQVTHSLDSQIITRQIQTSELAVDTVWLRSEMIEALHSVDVEIFTNSSVGRVQKVNQTWIAEVNYEESVGPFDIIVNCAWDGRLAIDHSSGFRNEEPELVRLKYGFLLDGTTRVPSLTMTHGPFGDIVNFSKSNEVYISWYPHCMNYMETTTEIPDKIDAICNGNFDPDQIDSLFRNTRSVITSIAPELESLALKGVRVGTILGQGTTDISDLSSGLHKRLNGIREVDKGYYSVFTAKYTSAPLNTVVLSGMIDP